MMMMTMMELGRLSRKRTTQTNAKAKKKTTMQPTTNRMTMYRP